MAVDSGISAAPRIDSLQVDPRDEVDHELRERALTLRAAGATYQQGARQMQVSVAEFARLVVDALRESEAMQQREAALLRALELTRLDRAIAHITARLYAPDPAGESTGSRMHREKRQAKLLGELRQYVELRCRVAGFDLLPSGAAQGGLGATTTNVNLNVLFSLQGGASDVTRSGLEQFVARAIMGDAATIEAARDVVELESSLP